MQLQQQHRGSTTRLGGSRCAAAPVPTHRRGAAALARRTTSWRPSTVAAALQASPQQDHRRMIAVAAANGTTQKGGTALSVVGTLALIAANAATILGPKTQLLPQLLVHSLGVGFLVKSLQDLRVAHQQRQDSSPSAAAVAAPQPEPQAVRLAEPAQEGAKAKVMLQMEAALCEATRVAQREASEAAAVACMNRALRHTNANLAKQLREERALRLQQRLRFERLHRELNNNGAAATSTTSSSSPLLAVTCDPAVERAVLHMVQSEEVRAVEQQLTAMRQELLATRTHLERERARADACEAASRRHQQN